MVRSTITLPKAIKLLPFHIIIFFMDSAPFQISTCLPSLVQSHWMIKSCLCEGGTVCQRFGTPYPLVLAVIFPLVYSMRVGAISQSGWNCLQSLNEPLFGFCSLMRPQTCHPPSSLFLVSNDFIFVFIIKKEINQTMSSIGGFT